MVFGDEDLRQSASFLFATQRMKQASNVGDDPTKLSLVVVLKIVLRPPTIVLPVQNFVRGAGAGSKI